jgi:polyhydroxyalkanoate synthesis regulator phasin
MPKKANTQLNEVVLMLKDAVSRGPLTTERKKAFLKDVQEKFKCSDKTAYYYYFYKAQKVLKADGVEVMASKPKAVKKTKAVKSTSEMISDLPKPMQEQMKAGNPFAQLMTA